MALSIRSAFDLVSRSTKLGATSLYLNCGTPTPRRSRPRLFGVSTAVWTKSRDIWGWSAQAKVVQG
jgi:hypothetical protein